MSQLKHLFLQEAFSDHPLDKIRSPSLMFQQTLVWSAFISLSERAPTYHILLSELLNCPHWIAVNSMMTQARFILLTVYLSTESVPDTQLVFNEYF